MRGKSYLKIKITLRNKPEHLQKLKSQFYVEIVRVHGKRIDLILIPKIDSMTSYAFDNLIQKCDFESDFCDDKCGKNCSYYKELL